MAPGYRQKLNKLNINNFRFFRFYTPTNRYTRWHFLCFIAIGESDVSYKLHKSWHKSTRPDSLDLTIDTTQWKKLKIISATENNVHFVAYFTQDTLNKEKIYALTEISHFVKDKNWQYLEGEDVKTVQLTKNMPCPCQSGKKYKRCCESELK